MMLVVVIVLVVLMSVQTVQSFSPRSSFLSQGHVSRNVALYKTGKIHEAIIAGDIPTAVQLMEEDPKAYKARDIEGMQPLHHAARNGQIDLVQILIAKGADCNAQNDKLRTPLQLAAQYSDGKWGPEFRTIVEMMVRTGKADINMIQRNDGMLSALDRVKKHGWGRELKALWEEHGSYSAGMGVEKSPGPGGFAHDLD